MKRILYLANVEVPYRARFFQMLSQQVDLTVLFESKKTTYRDETWMNSLQLSYKKEYLGGFHTRDDNRFSLSIITWIRKGWDLVIVGGYNSPVQAFAILLMRIMRIPFAISTDGESFIGNDLKSSVKKFFLHGAKLYLAAGEKSSEELKRAIHPKVPVYVYNFSSLTREDLLSNKAAYSPNRKDYILVVAGYFEYKRIDVVLDVARMDKTIRYKFVGMGNRTNLFLDENKDLPSNVEVIPFMQTKELYQAYAECKALVLPSRQECWGLVVSEAASFGTPIVSTYGSGAAREFIMDQYPQYLAMPGDVKGLYQCICQCLSDEKIEEYSEFLLRKSENYCLETCVNVHVSAINSL